MAMRALGVVGRNPQNYLCRRGSKGYDWFYKQLDRDAKAAAEGKLLSKMPLLPAAASGVRRPKVWMDISKGDEALGRVTFELAADILPKTCENFLRLCNGTAFHEGMSYKNTLVHKVAHMEYLQGGDVLMEEGMGSHSAFEKSMFEDEAFVVSHRAGVLSMASSGVNRNGSQFFVTLKDCRHLNGRHVAFGAVVDGLDILTEIGKSLCVNGKPVVPTVIHDCGELEA